MGLPGIEGGSFTLEVPIAAGYDELKKTMALAFKNGKLFFSEENPALYIAVDYTAPVNLVVYSFARRFHPTSSGGRF